MINENSSGNSWMANSWLSTGGAGSSCISLFTTNAGIAGFRVVGCRLQTLGTLGNGISTIAANDIRGVAIADNEFRSLVTCIDLNNGGAPIAQWSNIGNTFSAATTGIHMGLGGNVRNGITSIGNHFTGVTTPFIGGGGANIIRGNEGWATENSGSATIPNGSTSVVVTHGLSVTPGFGSISLLAAGLATNDIGYLYASNITATQFTINCRNNPGASGQGVGWQVAVLKS